MIRQLSATESTICAGNMGEMGEKSYMTERMEQNSVVKPDFESKYLKKFPNIYVPVRRFYLPCWHQLAAGSHDEPGECSPHLHTPVIRGALIFSFHPIPVVDILLRYLWINQLDANFFLYIYFYSLHVSGSYVPIIRRINCINATPGICHSV